MQDYITITGMVLKTELIGEYDKRVVILTKEKGKISTFAKGCRRPGSRLMAVANPFSFGEFKLFAGKSSYNILEANISNYFEELRKDFESTYYGMYFLEIADYYTRENLDGVDMLRLLYQTMRALTHEKYNKLFLRCVFEIRAIVISGEYPGVPAKTPWKESTLYAMNYIEHTGIEKLYAFEVSEEVLKELRQIAEILCKRFMDRRFLSLEIIDSLP